MRMVERMRGLDRRAETFGQRFQRKHDQQPPAAFKYGYFFILFLSVASILLTVATSRVVSITVLVAALAVYTAAAVVWSRRHRV